jgi:HD superfamily phosphohydrolase
MLCCFGLFLLFASNQATILTVFPYPPFGFVSISTLCLSAYFFYIGIYFSVISITSNNELRKIIKDITSKYDLRLLDEISSANILSEIEKSVIENISNRDDSNQSLQVNESEIKEYVEDILNELRNNSIRT